MSSNLIEVETRFVVTPKCRFHLSALLGPPSTSHLHDIYYGPHLALSDWWLRSRNGCLELKLPPDSNGTLKSEHDVQITEARPLTRSVVFRELDSEAAMHVLRDAGVAKDERAVRELRVYADIVTHRFAWKTTTRAVGLDMGDCSERDVVVTIDDATSGGADEPTERRSEMDGDGTAFQYAVGEIEVSVHGREEVGEASRIVEDVCRTLGLTAMEGSAGSKVIRYMYAMNHPLYDKLYSKGLV